MKSPSTMIGVLLFIVSLQLPSYAVAEKILVIESYHQSYSWDQGFTRAFQEFLGAEHELTFFEMNTKRLDSERFNERAELAYQTYFNLKPDIVILTDDNALRLVGPMLAGEPTPVFFLGINNNPRDYFDLTIPRNMTGLLERPIISREAINNIKAILPDAKKALVMIDDGITAQGMRDHFIKNQRGSVGKIRMKAKMHQTFSQWRESVLTAKENGYDLIFVATFQRLLDDDGSFIDADKLIRWTSENTPVPPFAFLEFGVGEQRTIGGTIADSYMHGVLSAQQVLSYLETGKMPLIRTPDKGVFLYNQAMLSKWRLSIPEKLKSRSRQR